MSENFITVQMYGEFPKSWQSCCKCGTPIWTECLNDFCENCEKELEDQRLNKLKIEKMRQPIDESDRWAIWERDNFTCQKCGSKKFLTIDHIKAVRNGGKSRLDNYQTLCRNCNSAKGAR